MGSDRKKKKLSLKRPKQRSLNGQTHKLALYALFALILVIVISKGISLVSSFYQPLTDKTTRHTIWNGSSTINVIIQSNQLSLVSFDPSEKKLIVVKFPDDTYLDLPFGYGKYQVRSIYTLGQAEKPAIGGRLLEETLKINAGLGVDGYIVTQNSWQDKSVEDLTINIGYNPLKILSLLRNIHSDLSSYELIRFLYSIQGVRDDHQTVIDLGRSSITKSILLPDGSRALGVETVKLDMLIQDNFEDTRMSGEGLSIGIYNATSHPRLAEGVARVITNMGGRVIFTSNANVPQSVSGVYANNNSYTKKRIAELFAANCLKEKSCPDADEEIKSSRADVTLVLGEDYYLYSTTK